MKRNVQILLFLAFCLLAIPVAASAQTGVNGVFEHFTVGKGSGDLEGWRIAVFTAHDQHYAIVQEAGGGAEDPIPVLVEVAVKGKTISFTTQTGTYTGTVSARSLVLKNADGNKDTLKRVSSAGYFK